jgi:ribose transport system substrate-binding protein
MGDGAVTTLGFSTPIAANAAGDAMVRGFASILAPQGGRVLVSDGGLDPVRQAAGLGRLVDAGVDAMLVYPAGDPQFFHPAIDDAVRNGVRIFAYGDLEHRAVEAELVTRIDEMGAAGADLLAAALGGTGTVAVVGGVDAPGVTDRINGFLRQLESAHPDMEVVATVHNLFDNADGAEAVVAEMLRNGPGPAGIFAYNDSSAVGAARAAAAAGVSPALVGSNGEPHGVSAVAEGVLAGTVDRHPVELAQRGAELFLELLARPATLGAPVKVSIAPTVVTPANVGEFVPWNDRCATPPAGSWEVID